MNKFIVFVALFFVSMVTQAEEVLPCNFDSPRFVIRVITDTEVEYKFKPEYKEAYAPFKVQILKWSGWSTCMLKLDFGVSLIVPKGFYPEKEYDGTDIMKRSWVKVGNSSYPIISAYKLAVVQIPEEKIILVPPQNVEFQYRQPLLPRVYEPKEKEQKESRCGGWCIAFWGVGALLLGREIYNHEHKDSQPPPPTPPPTGNTDPATGG